MSIESKTFDTQPIDFTNPSELKKEVLKLVGKLLPLQQSTRFELKNLDRYKNFSGNDFNIILDLALFSKLIIEKDDTLLPNKNKTTITKKQINQFLQEKDQQEKEQAKEDKKPLWLEENHIEKTKELFDNENVLEHIQNYLDHFIVGEEINRISLYLALLKQGNHVFIRGESSQGKTHLANNVLKTVPPNRVEKIADFSPQALKYIFREMGEEVDTIYLMEDVGSGNNLHIRLTSKDDGGGTALVTEKDIEGNFKSNRIKIPIKTFITTSVRARIDAQDLSRAHEFYVDSSREQTERIISFYNKQYANKDLVEDYTFDQKVCWYIYEQLREITMDHTEVIIPFSEVCNFPTNSWFMRRDVPRMWDFISLLTLTNFSKRISYTKEMKEKGKSITKRFIIADLTDIIRGFEWLSKLKSFSTGTGLSDSEEELLELLKQSDSTSFTTNDVIGLYQESDKEVASQQWIRKLLNGLYYKGYLFKEKNPENKTQNLYSFSGKKVHRVTINYREVEKCFQEWLEKKPDSVINQIKSHKNYSLFIDRILKDVPLSLRPIKEEPKRIIRKKEKQQTFEISDPKIQKLKQALKDNYLNKELLREEFKELPKEQFDSLLLESKKNGVIQKDKQGLYFLTGVDS